MSNFVWKDTSFSINIGFNLKDFYIKFASSEKHYSDINNLKRVVASR